MSFEHALTKAANVKLLKIHFAHCGFSMNA